MKNACRINDDGSVSILLNLRGGTTLEAIVTRADYEKHAEPFKGTWTAYKHQRTGKYYTRGIYKDPETGKKLQPMLHRLIMNPGKGEITAHINKNTLDCRVENMRNIRIGEDIDEVMAVENALNDVLELSEPDESLKQKPYVCACGQLMYTPGVDGKCAECVAQEVAAESHIRSPVKGVSFHKGKDKWEAKPFYKGKRYSLGYWPAANLYDANVAVETFRSIGPDAYFKLHPKGKGGKG